MAQRTIEEVRVMDLDQALEYLAAHPVFLHYDQERGIDLWSPWHPLPIGLRRSIVKYRQALLELMRQGDVRVCPNRSLHKSYTRGKRTCGVCKRINTESEIPMANTTVPEISYHAAMHQFVVSGRGTVGTVADCPIQRFAGLVRHAVTTAPDPEATANALASLDYSNSIDRWYAICTLIKHNATPFWSCSWVDDRMSTQKDNVLL